MHFTISKTSLQPALAAAMRVADRKSTMPMLANVCLRATASELKVAGTDLNVTAVSTLPLVGATAGGLTVGAKALYDIVANLPGDQVAIKRVENNWAEVKAGKVAYRIVGMPDRDFPKVPDAGEAKLVEVEASALQTLLERALPSVCNDETRFHLNGVLIESTGKGVRTVSTDGHRMAVCDARQLAGPRLDGGIIVPKKGVIELKKLLDGAKAVKVGMKRPYLFVESNGALLAVKLIDAQFPPYDQVIPKAVKFKATVPRAALLDAVKRCELLSSETRGLKLAFSAGTLTITSDQPDLGDVRDELDCEYTGEPILVGVAPKYLREALLQMDDGGVTIELVGALDPIALRQTEDPDSYLGIIMPMRV